MPESIATSKPEISLREYIEVRLNLVETQTILSKAAADARLEHMVTGIDTLKEYVDLRIENINNATALATDSLNKRLESMNEFRQQLNDQTRTFINRDEFGTLTAKLDADVRALRDTRGAFIGRDEFNAQIAKLEIDVQNLQLSKATLEGKASATSVYIAWAFSFVGILIGLTGILLKFVP